MEEYGTKPAKSGMYFGAFHGFKNDDLRQEAVDVGEKGIHGPRFGPLEHCHTTYAADVFLEYKSLADAKKDGFDRTTVILKIDGDLLHLPKECGEYAEYQYGDWTCFVS